MNTKPSLVALVLTLLVAAPLLAQESGTPAAAPQAPPAASAPAAAAKVEPAHIVGTLVALDTDRIEVMVERAVGPTAESASVLVGQTHAFVLDAATVKPAELKLGDHLDLWFTERDGKGYAVRVALVAEDGGTTSSSAAAPAPAAEPAQPAAPAAAPAPAGNPAAAATASKTAEAASAPAANPTTATTTTTTATATTATTTTDTVPADHPQAAAVKPKPQRSGSVAAADAHHIKPLVPPAVQPVAPPVSAEAGAGVTAVPPPAPAQAAPPQASAGSVGVEESVGKIGADTSQADTAVARRSDPFPFIGIGVAVALIALALLYFTLRGRGQVLDLGLHVGKGGVM